VPPTNVSEAVLDHDYTLLAVRRHGEGCREFWSHTIAVMKKMEAMVIEPTRAFLSGKLRYFKVGNVQKSFVVFDLSLIVGYLIITLVYRSLVVI
jgi:hypothetical protein